MPIAPLPPPAPSPVPVPPPPSNLAAASNAANWEIGPIIDGQNYSKGVPLHPASDAEGWSIEIPQPSSDVGYVGYVTTRYGSLRGKMQIRMRYRVEMDPAIRIYPKCCSGMQSTLTLYFQRRGDDWRSDGWRWWSTFAYDAPLNAGEHELVAPLDGNWTSVSTWTARTNPGAFQAAIDDADRVGFTFGGGDGWGHGVYATGPARIVVTEFRIE